eukprot:gb/GEZJ01002097.1/.p1 GENE.gb/GEZJ01002097.1/~~gb/GEZJ01002097.1/.p1  ORF type:complete len:548 (-),score=49.99 gb/GEZJ01002097.1/:2326-3807(-)
MAPRRLPRAPPLQHLLLPHPLPLLLLLLLLHIPSATCSPSSRAHYIHSQAASLHNTVHSYLENGGQQRMQKLFNLSRNVIYNPLHTFTREYAYERRPDGSVAPRYLTAPQQPTSDLQILRLMGLHVPGVDPEHQLLTTDRQNTQHCINAPAPVLIVGHKSDFLISYAPNTPASITSSVEFSVRKWADEFESDIRVRLCFAWVSMGDETLGSTTTPFLTVGLGSNRRIDDDSIYNPALAASLQGEDPIDDTTKFHVHMLLNSAISWHLDIGTRAPARKYDLATTVLHELTHGLFFTGTLKVPNRNRATAEFTTDKPGRFDQFMQVEGNIGVAKSCSSGDELFKAIISPNLRFVDKQSRSTFGLYAPYPFASGSSVYHFNNTDSLNRDCQRMGIANAQCSDLMTHELLTRYTQRNLGETTLRVYRAMRSASSGPPKGRACKVPDYSNRQTLHSTTTNAGAGPFKLQPWSIVTVGIIGAIGVVFVVGAAVSTLLRK